MHTMILENASKIKEIMMEEFEDALEDGDIETLHKVLDMECILLELKGHNPYGNPHNPGTVEGTANIKTMAPGPHGHGFGTVEFTTKA